MSVSFITYADFGKYNNLKTKDISSTILLFKKRGLISRVVCRLGKVEGINSKNALPFILHILVAGIGKFTRFLPVRKIEENFFDFFASKMEIPKGIIFFHPAKFLKTIKKARREGSICVGIAVNSSIESTDKLLEEELKKQNVKFFNKSKLLENDFANQMDYLITLSPFSKNTYVEYGFPEDKIYVANLDVDISVFYPKEKIDDIFTVIITTSSIGILKGLQYLIDAWQDFNIPNKKLIILGQRYLWPQKMEDKYKKIILQDKTIIELGMVNNVVSYIQNSDVSILPSFTEGFSRSVVESMACGIPVITTRNSTDVENFFEDNKHGLIVPIGDSKAITDALFFMYNNKEKRIEMGENARKAVVNKKLFSEEIFDIYQKIIKENI